MNVHRKRACWNASTELSVSASGCTVARSTKMRSGMWKDAFSSPLPTAGLSSWWVHIGHCKSGYIQIGCCTIDGAVAFGLAAYSGHGLVLATRRVSDTTHRWHLSEDGRNRVVETEALADADGRPVNLRRDATGAEVLVTMDHDGGQLSLLVNGRSWCRMAGFPPGAELRPWVALYDKGDRVSLHWC